MSEQLFGVRERSEPVPFRSEDRHAVEPLLHSSLRVLRRRKWQAIAVLLLFSVPAAIFVERRPFLYQATTRLLIERNDEATSVMKDPANGSVPVDGFFQTQQRLLSSRPVVVKAIQKSRLWESAQFRSDGAQTGSVEEIARTGLVDQFLAHLSVVPTTGTHLLNVTFEARDPTVAMNAANALAETYVSEDTASRVADSSKLAGWIDQRLAEQQSHLAESEAAVQTYMESHDAVSVQDRQNIVVQKLSDLNTALTRAKTERMSKEVQFRQLEAVRADPRAFDSLPIVLSNAGLQQLRSQLAELKQKELGMSQELGDRHPDMIKLRSEIELINKRLTAELATLAESVSNDFLAAQSIEKGLVSALETQKREVLGLNQKGLDYGALQREATSARQIYERLLNESRTRGVIGKTVDATIRIVEPAERPLAPIGPQNTRDLALVLAAGLLLALSVPLTLESIDHRVKTPADIEQHLHLPCVAMVPQVKGTPGGTRPLMTNESNSFNEAFRRIRTALRMTSHPQSALHVLVTSAVPGEGKSLVAANLAIAFARGGQRVLLIDADLRRPTVHTHFDLKASPGFANVLRRDSEARDSLRATSIPNLFVLPSGSSNSDDAELLSSPHLRTVLDVFDTKFNLIVFDSPPVGPVADACIIAGFAQHTLLVVAAGSTSMAAVAAASDQLVAAGAKMAGVILNRVDLEHSAYYYGPIHKSQYAAYYGPAADADSRAMIG